MALLKNISFVYIIYIGINNMRNIILSIIFSMAFIFQFSSSLTYSDGNSDSVEELEEKKKSDPPRKPSADFDADKDGKSDTVKYDAFGLIQDDSNRGVLEDYEDMPEPKNPFEKDREEKKPFIQTFGGVQLHLGTFSTSNPDYISRSKGMIGVAFEGIGQVLVIGTKDFAYGLKFGGQVSLHSGLNYYLPNHFFDFVAGGILGTGFSFRFLQLDLDMLLGIGNFNIFDKNNTLLQDVYFTIMPRITFSVIVNQWIRCDTFISFKHGFTADADVDNIFIGFGVSFGRFLFRGFKKDSVNQ
jgi:hypothetical protein